MRTVTRPAGIEIGNKGFCVTDSEQETFGDVQRRRVKESVEYALCDGPSRQMLLAVAATADKYGIAAGRDKATNAAHGVSVAALALRAGLPREVAENALRVLCDAGLLYRFTAPFPPFGLVWVLPEYDQMMGDLA